MKKLYNFIIFLVPRAGLEPARPKSRDFKSPLSTISASRHNNNNKRYYKQFHKKYLFYYLFEKDFKEQDKLRKNILHCKQFCVFFI